MLSLPLFRKTCTFFPLHVHSDQSYSSTTMELFPPTVAVIKWLKILFTSAIAHSAFAFGGLAASPLLFCKHSSFITGEMNHSVLRCQILKGIFSFHSDYYQCNAKTEFKLWRIVNKKYKDELVDYHTSLSSCRQELRLRTTEEHGR